MFPLAIKYQGKKTIHITITPIKITTGVFEAVVLYLIRPIFCESIAAQVAEPMTITHMVGSGPYIPTKIRPNVTDSEDNQTIISLSLWI